MSKPRDGKPRRTALLYALAGALWIVFSDRFLDLMIANQGLYPRLQTIKGLFFITATAALLYLSLRFYTRQLEREAAGRARATESLATQELQYRLLFEAIPHPMWVFDLESLAFLIVNDAAIAKYGYSKEEFLGMTIEAIRSPEDSPALVKNISRIGEGLDNIGIWRHRLKSGAIILVELVRHTIIFSGRKAVLVLAHDITDQVRAGKALRESEERLRLALEASGMGLYDLNVQTGEAVINPEYAVMLGYLPGELHETNAGWRDRLHPDDRDEVYRAYEEYVAGARDEYRIEFRQRTKSGEWKWILSIGKIVERDSRGEPLRMLGTHMDLTGRVKAEEAIRRSLREKEVMLREIHHRVKNNLQVILSMLALQEGFIENDRDRELFRDSRRRVSAMAKVHEKLYTSADLSHIDFDDFIEVLTADILNAYPSSHDRVRISVVKGGVNLDVNKAIPCAQIVNELVSNAIKYAFPGERSGVVSVRLGKEGERYVLRVADDGAGLPAGFVFPGKDSLGLTIVQALVAQLEGTMDFDSSAGVSYVVSFSGR